MVSGGSMTIAWLKLRQRNLGPLLDGDGWAVNSKAKINIPFGTTLTSLASLPPGSTCDLVDPYAEKKVRWKPWVTAFIVIVIVFSWWQGKLDIYLPKPVRSTHVLGEFAPAFQPSAQQAVAPAPEGVPPKAK